MSTLHRLKAYFGMVPAEEFEAAEFAVAEFDDYRSGHSNLGDDSQGHDDDSFVPRSPSWAAQAPVLGSLAIDTVASNARPVVRQRAAAQRVAPVPRSSPLAEDPLGETSAHPLARIVTLHPHSYNEARPIGERYREGNPVIMNLTGMEDRDAKRLVDFAAGLAFALRGSIDKVTNKVFLLSPSDVDVSAEDRRRIAEGRFFN
jgi:cell division inhibitor SepF